MPATASGRDVHLDVPLSNLAIKAFQGSGDFIAQKVFPIVNVNKQNNKYYITDKDTWLSTPDTKRAPKTAPKRVEFKVSSDGYFCDNYSLAAENSKEDLSNAEAAIRVRQNSVKVVTDMLLRDYEIRVANKITTAANLGSGVALTGTNKWNDFVNSSPMSDVTTAQATIRKVTGLMANTGIMDEDTFAIVRRHPELLDMFKYTMGGQLSGDQIKSVFNLKNLWIPSGVKNVANEGQTASIVNIWGNNFVLAVVNPGTSLETQTLGLSIRWQPAGVPAAMQVSRYDDPDPGKKVEVVESGYYQDEKIVAADLGYAITGTL